MITAGPFAPTVTQHIATAGTADVMGDASTTFADRPVQTLAVYPGNALEADTAAADVVTADLVLLLNPDVTVSAADQFTYATLRYRVEGQPGRYVHPATGTAVTQVALRRITTV